MKSDKPFSEEIKKFHKKLVDGENFSIARFGDGEMMALRGETVVSGCGEWNTNGVDPRYHDARILLNAAYTYQDPGYYVGIVCPCCQGQENFKKMKYGSGQPESNLTYANLFVNTNYPFFLNQFIPEFQKRKIVLVANETSRLDRLPFTGRFVSVKYNAWIENQDLVNWDISGERDIVFLFACGPLGKILAQQWWSQNKNNTYLDIGSTLYPWLGSDLNIRTYYQQGWSGNPCYWGD
jgi:hypothetical protein